MSALELRGLGASGGVAIGRAVLLEDAPPADEDALCAEDEPERALAALDAVVEELTLAASRLRADGLAAEAEILEANGLMAADPVLREEVARLAARLPAATALQQGAERHAELLASLADPLLAARAADVRELGKRAARRVCGTGAAALPAEPSILLARDLGPADVAELRESGGAVCGLALAEGAATSHAAIMARSLGLPMAVALGDALLELVAGETVVLDGDRGVAVASPEAGVERWARGEMDRLERARRRYAAHRPLPAVTRDGRWVTLLCNAASAVEIRAALESEADGVGLLRTELAFLEADAWPSEDAHVEQLAPLLAMLRETVTTVRVLDFGADKTPPFLAGTEERGLALLLAHEDALAAQLRAILHAGREARLRILLPLVESVEQLREVRTLLRRAAAQVGRRGALPPLGAMVETPEAAARAAELAREADFMSIGTNDLVQYTLCLDREQPLATARSAADPRVLRHVEATVAAAHAAGLQVEVCGEAAGEPALAALFVGLGVDELSVAPARVDGIRALVRGLSATVAADAAAAALAAGSLEQALAVADRLVSERRDESGELVDGLDGVVA